MSARRAVRPFAPLVIAGLTALLIVWLPLPFGSVVVWSHLAFQLAAFALLALVSVLLADCPLVRRAILPTLALAAVAALGFAQSASWPADIVRVISPEHARLQEQAADLAGGMVRDAPAPTLSLAPDVTRHAALSWAAVAACLLVASCVARGARERRVLLAGVIAAAVFQLLYGTTALATQSRTIWGVAVPGDPTRLRGTFVNADHLAYFLEIALTASLAWTWWAIRRTRWESTHERRVLLVAPPVLLWLTMFVGLAFTGSRAGLIAVIAATLGQGAAVAASERRWRIGATGLAALVAGLGAVAAVSLQQGFGRWLATSRWELTWNDRVMVYARSLDLWTRFPLSGSGLSTFRDAFPLVQPTELTGSYWHAHNDYVELLVTAGVLGAALVLTALVTSLRGMGRVLQDGQRSEDRAAALAAIGAFIAVAVHSVLDFGLSMPANAATLAILVGAALGSPTASDARAETATG